MTHQAELEVMLARSALGDRDAFQRLYEATAPRVYAVLLSMLRDSALAQDVMQDAYVKVWGQSRDYHADRGLVLSWIIAIARYRALDLLRASKRRDALEMEAVQQQSLTEPTQEGFSDLLRECLGKLADLQRRSIVAAFVNGFTHEELAAREATPVGTVKSRIRRGMQRLRECLQQ
jgi:RNA polymerase sigma-70 factor (ECF subfamily)